jgi:hypothetical protein
MPLAINYLNGKSIHTLDGYTKCGVRCSSGAYLGLSDLHLFILLMTQIGLVWLKIGRACNWSWLTSHNYPGICQEIFRGKGILNSFPLNSKS